MTSCQSVLARSKLSGRRFDAQLGEEARAAAAVLGEGAPVLLVASASHIPRAIRHFQQAGLQPIAAPTHYLALRDDMDTLSYWIPSARYLRKSERAFYEWLGMMAVGWE